MTHFWDGKDRRAFRNRYLAFIDLLGWTLALFAAYSIRFERFDWPPGNLATFATFLPIALLVRFIIIYRAGLYRRLWRYAGVVEMERILSVTLTAAVILIPAGVWILPAVGIVKLRVPISVAIMDSVFMALIVAGPRFLIRSLAGRGRRVRSGKARRRAIIAGAGSAGELIAKELLRSPDLGVVPVGFVDDDPQVHGQEMCGLPVLGPLGKLVDYRERYQCDELIIAMPDAPGTAVRSIMREAAAAGLEAKTIPGLFEFLSGRVSITSLRPIQIEDLLRREPVRTELDQVQALVENKTVLVTGAGGSIGSELCRQIAALGPGRLILLGHGENSIFNVCHELSERFPSVDMVPAIVDVRDRRRLGRVFSRHRPQLVLHAAAHKHVPLMELNVPEAVTNNVLGTANVAEAAVEHGVQRFVMVSTDKAVRPTNVMGASKRVAEQIVQDCASRFNVNMIAVRFGNVLGSRGSVVPVFLRQIENGGPVTVTHPEMRRYFMTIPEAVQLVLQAAVLGTGGEVFVLDMGEPVKIADLALDLIRLSGLEPGRDIEIHFTGVRPGEKLHEELFFSLEQATPTVHPKVLRAKHAELPIGLGSVTRELIDRARADADDDELRRLLIRLVPDYQPENSVHNISSLRSLDARPIGERSIARPVLEAEQTPPQT